MGVRRVLVALFLLGGLAISACSSGEASKGVLTGRAWSCMTVHPVTVQVYGTLYPGKWSAALERVSSLGADSGEPLVASRQIPSGGTYHFTLAAGRYVVAGAVPARLVTVIGGKVTTVKNFRGAGCI
jgi:hypothetical protein